MLETSGHTEYDRNLLDIFMFILISDGDVPSVGYQINCISFAKLFIVNRKRKLNNAFYVVFTIRQLASSTDRR